MGLREGGRRVCIETCPESRHTKWRRLCGCNPAIIPAAVMRLCIKPQHTCPVNIMLRAVKRVQCVKLMLVFGNSRVITYSQRHAIVTGFSSVPSLAPGKS